MTTLIACSHGTRFAAGRDQPSRDMILRLAAELEVPLRERNAMLLSAGYAPIFADRPLDDQSLSHIPGTLRSFRKRVAPDARNRIRRKAGPQGPGRVGFSPCFSPLPEFAVGAPLCQLR